jgi:hypothetical protein
VCQAIAVGAHAIGIAGGMQNTFNLERLVSDVGARTAESTSKAADTTTDLVNPATEAMQKASREAKNAITEAGKDARQSFADNVDNSSIRMTRRHPWQSSPESCTWACCSLNPVPRTSSMRT